MEGIILAWLKALQPNEETIDESITLFVTASFALDSVDFFNANIK